jgi:hypothetical protein
MSEPSSLHRRASQRQIIVIWTIVVLLVAWHITVVVQAFLPYAWSGVDIQGGTVTTVARDSAAKRARLRRGDRFGSDDATRAFLSAREFYRLVRGQPYTVTVKRDNENFTTTIVPDRTTVWQQDPPNAWARLCSAVAFVISFIVAGILLTLRPGTMTVSLALATLACGFPYIDIKVAPQLVIPLDMVGSILFQSTFCSALVVFALRFPDDRVSGWRAPAQRVAWGFLAVTASVVCATALIAAFRGLAAEELVGERVVKVFDAFQALTVVTAGAILFLRSRQTDGASSARIRWATLGIVVPLVAVGIALIVGDPILWGVAVLSYVIFPASVLYVLPRARFVDSRFIVSRAAVLTATGIVVGVVIYGSDWMAAKFVFEPRAHALTPVEWIATGLEALVAVTLGFALHAIYRWIEGGIERIVFREKHETEAFLKLLGKSLLAAPDEAVIEEALASVVPREMHLASAAVFRCGPNGVFIRGKQTNWSDNHTLQLTKDDQLVRFLLETRRPLSIRAARWARVDVPAGTAAPALAVPISLSDTIAAIVLYGAHEDRTQIDVSERDALTTLAERASAAFEHVQALSIRAALAECESRCADLTRGPVRNRDALS